VFRFDQVPERTLNAGGTHEIALAAAYATKRELRGKKFSVTGSIWYDYSADFRRLLNETGYPLPNVSFSGEGELQ
jgi:hypothetical protein